MKLESMFSLKEYLHLAFITGLFAFSVVFYDLSNAESLAWSFIVIALVSVFYAAQHKTLDLDYWKFGKSEDSTNYQIIGPFGFVLFASWIAYVDFSTPNVISKYTGIVILFSLMHVFPVTSEISDRCKERIIPENSKFVHNVCLWLFMAILFFVATTYFIAQGSWEWDIPNPLDILNTALRTRDVS